MKKLREALVPDQKKAGADKGDDEKQVQEVQYTPALEELQRARFFMTEFSIKR